MISLRPHFNIPHKFLTEVPLPFVSSPIESIAFSFKLSAETNILQYINRHPEQTFHIVVIAGTIYGNMQVSKCSLTVQQQGSQELASQSAKQTVKQKPTNLTTPQRRSSPVQMSEDASVIAIEMDQPKTVSNLKGSWMLDDTSSAKLLQYRGVSAIDGEFQSLEFEGVATGSDKRVRFSP